MITIKNITPGFKNVLRKDLVGNYYIQTESGFNWMASINGIVDEKTEAIWIHPGFSSINGRNPNEFDFKQSKVKVAIVTGLSHDKIPNSIWQSNKLERLVFVQCSLKMPSRASLNTLKDFAFSLCEIDRMPDWVTSLKTLRALSIRGCKLKKAPGDFKDLSNLKLLDLQNNLLKRLPRFKNLPMFLTIDLRGNHLPLKKVCTSLMDCSQRLQITNIDESTWDAFYSVRVILNDVKVIPPEIKKVSGCLCDLSLLGCCIEKLPEEIGSLKLLQNLDLSYNCLTRIPKSIGGLQSLERMNFDSNSLVGLPEEMSSLKALKRLSLRDNKIKVSEELLKSISHVHEVYLNGNF